MRAISYFRLDSSGPTELGQLREALTRYCREEGHSLEEAFADDLQQGQEAPKEYQRMLDYMRASGKEYLIIVPDARHLGSDLYGVAATMEELESLEARVICWDPRYPDPLQNALEVIGAKGVSRSRSERISEAMRSKAIMGLGLGRPPYGYRIGQGGVLEIESQEASVVQRIFDMYSRESLGLRLIVQRLNQEGVRTRRDGLWNIVTVRDVLRNRAYIGTYQRFGMQVTRSHQPIIDPETFRAVQERMRERRPSRRANINAPFLLSGLVYCGYCGGRMTGMSRVQRWRRKDGQRVQRTYRYYQCQSRTNQGMCQYHTRRATELEESVLDRLREALKHQEPEGAVELAIAPQDPASQQARLKSAERRFLTAFRRAAGGEVSVRYLGQVRRELSRIRQGSTDWQAPSSMPSQTGDLEKWEELSFSQQRAILEGLLERVVVQDSSAEVNLK